MAAPEISFFRLAGYTPKGEMWGAYGTLHLNDPANGGVFGVRLGLGGITGVKIDGVSLPHADDHNPDVGWIQARTDEEQKDPKVIDKPQCGPDIDEVLFVVPWDASGMIEICNADGCETQTYQVDPMQPRKTLQVWTGPPRIREVGDGGLPAGGEGKTFTAVPDTDDQTTVYANAIGLVSNVTIAGNSAPFLQCGGEIQYLTPAHGPVDEAPMSVTSNRGTATANYFGRPMHFTYENASPNECFLYARGASSGTSITLNFGGGVANDGTDLHPTRPPPTGDYLVVGASALSGAVVGELLAGANNGPGLYTTPFIYLARNVNPGMSTVVSEAGGAPDIGPVMIFGGDCLGDVVATDVVLGSGPGGFLSAPYQEDQLAFALIHRGRGNAAPLGFVFDVDTRLVYNTFKDFEIFVGQNVYTAPLSEVPGEIHVSFHAVSPGPGNPGGADESGNGSSDALPSGRDGFNTGVLLVFDPKNGPTKGCRWVPGELSCHLDHLPTCKSTIDYVGWLVGVTLADHNDVRLIVWPKD